MRPILLVLLCAFAGVASAQATPGTGADVAPKAAGNNPSSQDPRVCLEFPTRQQVIACAEKYRPKRAVAKS